MVDELKVVGTDGITRSLDEHYDVQSAVENDPCGALFAIQNQAARIEALEAQVAAADAMAVALEAAYSFIFDEYYQPNRPDGECLEFEARGPVDTIINALAAYNEAKKGGA